MSAEPQVTTARLSGRERAIVLLPAALLVAVALFHIAYLHPVLGMSKWKGGGLGVYCTIYERRVATWVDLADGAGYRLAHTTPYAQARFFAGWFPFVPFMGEGWLAGHGQATLRTAHVEAEALREQPRAVAGAGAKPARVVVQRWEYAFDSQQRAHWRLIDLWRGGGGD